MIRYTSGCMFRKLFFILVILAILGTGWYVITNKHSQTSKSSQKAVSGFNKQRYSLSEPKSLWVIVNKRRALPSDYVPAGLRTPSIPYRGGSGNKDESLLRDDAASAAESLVGAAKKDSIELMMVSGYRSYNLQAVVYESFVKTQGKQEADRTSARPGHSEHQTGLALDFVGTDGKCQIEECFANTPAASWLNDHAADYGFVLRYAKDTQPIVGYAYEPWHFRYVGTELAKEIKKTGTTLEQFFNLSAAPDYN